MKRTITLPLGARLAAEKAYANMQRVRRSDPAYVAEVILTAAAPFMAPVLAQLGRGRVSEDGARDIFRLWLSGVSSSELAGRFAVTPQTISKYVRRGMTRTATRLASGASAATIAAENQVPPSVIASAISDWEARHAA